MEQRVKVSGYVEVPEGYDVSTLMGKRVTGTFTADVDGDHKDRQKRRGGAVKVVHTAVATIIEGATIDKVTDAPADDGTGSMGDPSED